MAKIKILPENISNKIAAGEVVQRPESVVKELLENAIDAGANNIDVFIKNAGKSLIQVCDDGYGMVEEDAILSIQKHATSKIANYDDIHNLKTLGFRGEALSSIASISQLEIKTQTKNDELGTYLKVMSNDEIISEKGSFVKGTTIIVKNIFYNVPARRKFLKSNQTEFKHICKIFKEISLSNNDISFKLFNDGDVLFKFKSCSLKERIAQVFADNIIDALIEVKEETEYLSVNGFIGKPAMLKSCKGDQYIFVNGRFVISRQINHAIFSAYQTVLQKGDYPFFVLFLDINPHEIDVNIHPSKMEIKFEDDRNIYNMVLAIIRKSLGLQDSNLIMTENGSIIEHNLEPVSQMEKEFSNTSAKYPSNLGNTNYSDFELDKLFGNIQNDFTNNIPEQIDDPFSKPFQNEILHKSNTIENEEYNNSPKLILQIHDRYILSQIKSGMIVVDQNLAHTRILYDNALNQLQTGLTFSQQLLFPRNLSLDENLIRILKDNLELINKLGFSLKLFKKNKIEIKGVPEDVKHGKEDSILIEILKKYESNNDSKNENDVELLARYFAESTALRANTKLTEKEMLSIINHLFTTTNPYICPNGKPTLIEISLNELEKRFGNLS